MELSLAKFFHSITIDEIELRLLWLFFFNFIISLLIKENQTDTFHIYTYTFFYLVWLMALFLTIPFLLSRISICSEIPIYLHCCIFTLQSKISLPLRHQLQTLFHPFLEICMAGQSYCRLKPLPLFSLLMPWSHSCLWYHSGLPWEVLWYLKEMIIARLTKQWQDWNDKGVYHTIKHLGN